MDYAVVSDSGVFGNVNHTLYCALVAYRHVPVQVNIVYDDTVSADGGVLAYVNEAPDLCSIPDYTSLMNVLHFSVGR